MFLEAYTSILAVEKAELEALYGQDVVLADRQMVESEAETILGDARAADVAFCVVGDPFGATTHMDLRLRAHIQGIEVWCHSRRPPLCVCLCGCRLESPSTRHVAEPICTAAHLGGEGRKRAKGRWNSSCQCIIPLGSSVLLVHSFSCIGHHRAAAGELLGLILSFVFA